MSKYNEFNDLEFPETYSTESLSSIESYKKAAQKYKLLTKEEEIELATKIRDAKKSILKLCVQSDDCITELYALKSLNIIELRKMFFGVVEENAPKEEILKALDGLELLLVDRVKKVKGSEAKLHEFLLRILFTERDLRHISQPIKDFGTATQVKHLETHLNAMQAARTKLVTSNLRLVFSRAKTLLNKGLSLEDLIQEGNIGLLKAIEKYDVEKGYKFSTYATWWIDQALGRALSDKARLIRVPVHMVDNINKMSKINNKLQKELGRDPSIEELSESMHISEEKAEKVKNATSPINYIEDLASAEGRLPMDSMADEEAVSPLDYIMEEELNDRVRELLSTLDPTDEKIMRLRFGIGEKSASTHSAIGAKLEKTRENVRQRVERSLKKLKRSSRSESFWIERNVAVLRKKKLKIIK
jgi:RNA polymerase sigma factor (sigma-70 family)